MSDRAKIDAFLSATDAMVSGLGVCSPVERGEDRMGTVVADAVCSAERQLNLIAYPFTLDLAGDLIYVHNREFSKEPVVAEARLEAVRNMLGAKGIVGARDWTSEGTYVCIDGDGRMRMRYRYLGAGIVDQSPIIAMDKLMTHIRDNGSVGGQEEQIIVLNASHGVLPLTKMKDIPRKTVGIFGRYIGFARSAGYDVEE